MSLQTLEKTFEDQKLTTEKNKIEKSKFFSSAEKDQSQYN